MDIVKSEELSTLVDTPVGTYTVKVFRYNWLDKLLRKPIERKFTLYRCRVCNMGRAGAIAELLPELDTNITSMEQLTGVVLPLVHNHRKNIVYLIACCIQNNNKEPKKSLIRFLDNNLNAEQLFELINICLSQMGLMSFLSATVLVKGVNVSFVSDMAAEPVTTQE